MPGAVGLERTYRIERVSASTSPRLFQQLAKLHIDSIHGGILEALGPNFVASLYRQLGKRCDVLMFTALQEDRVIGFVAGSSNVRRSLRNLGIAGFGALAIPRAQAPGDQVSFGKCFGRPAISSAGLMTARQNRSRMAHPISLGLNCSQLRSRKRRGVWALVARS